MIAKKRTKKQKPRGVVDVYRQLKTQGIGISQIYRWLQRQGICFSNVTVIYYISLYINH